jgi:hypothetical protein
LLSAICLLFVCYLSAICLLFVCYIEMWPTTRDSFALMCRHIHDDDLEQTENLAAHNVAMECYRRALLGEQTFEGRQEHLNQVNKPSRTYAVLLDALNRHCGKGQQKVTVEHVHVQAGGEASTVETEWIRQKSLKN